MHVNFCLLLWYLAITFIALGVHVDEYESGRVTRGDAPAIVVTAAILLAWLFGTYLLNVWAAQPPRSAAKLRDWRATLTALANGFEPQPSPRATFASMIAPGTRGAREYPRFVADTIEFGDLHQLGHGALQWSYLAARLPAPLPHLVLDASSNDRARSDLPMRLNGAQRLSLEGDFDKTFRLYAPDSYERDALYVLTPDVMAVLVDAAAGFNVEILDDTVVFFTRVTDDLAEPARWQGVHELLTRVVPRLIARARQYRDERVAGQDTPRVAATISAAIAADSDAAASEPVSHIGPDGRRLERRNPRWSRTASVLGLIGWGALLILLYVVPGLFAFAGLMSVVDGRVG
ncbi:hypothetical protein GCM10022287_07720 [Gryllotalpicola koreensis]|uniref:DUF3137 domain-containing protein n=1 Tax=Gryllotalpicola koreensis TaxID=993086 RepID=A0ABP7ZU72_9MICO